MKIEKIEERTIEELNGYKEVDIGTIEGLEYPAILRKNTLDRFVSAGRRQLFFC